MTTERNTEREIECGETLIEVLGLHVKRNGRVNTTWGDKTPLGLYLTVKRILEEAEENHGEN